MGNAGSVNPATVGRSSAVAHLQTPQGLEILSGLAPGETVVVDGAATLREGQPLSTP